MRPCRGVSEQAKSTTTMSRPLRAAPLCGQGKLCEGTQELRAGMLTRPVQACSTASGAHRYECVPTMNHAADEAACTRAWACMVSITLGAVTPGSELADAVEPDPMPRSNDATVTGTAAHAGRCRRQTLPILRLFGDAASIAELLGASMLGALQPACCSTAYSQALRPPPDRTAAVASDRSAASRSAVVA